MVEKFFRYMKRGREGAVARGATEEDLKALDEGLDETKEWKGCDRRKKRLGIAYPIHVCLVCGNLLIGIVEDIYPGLFA
ncbi:MAG TPA: hypothetical protein VEL11_12030 [Candidatus Bathyarchaeia archaeon]|nr:hypothetical protein [Candidatus Bathyarchaeia archaeon]